MSCPTAYTQLTKMAKNGQKCLFQPSPSHHSTKWKIFTPAKSDCKWYFNWQFWNSNCFISLSDLGDLCKHLLVDHRELMVSFVPQRFQEDLWVLMCKIWVIIKIYTSKEKVNVSEFKQFCLDVYYHILNSFNNKESHWINVSPTVHALSAHSWELIRNNGGVGLGNSQRGVLSTTTSSSAFIEET